MAYINGEKHFGQYTYEHWFDHEYMYKNDIIIDELTIDEINYVSNMIDKIFVEFVGKDYSVEGNNTFKDNIRPRKIFNRLTEEKRKIFTAKLKNEIVGIMEIKNENHISLFFVKKEFHGQGIGKHLFWHYLKMIMNGNTGIKRITVNSSFYAEKIYSKLGFIKTNEMQEKDGIKYIPMEYKI
jgi:predicted GNAT family N-acyltransferase